MVSCPPTGHNSPSKEPSSAALTHAAASPEHPGYPQPPQLAPGKASATWAIRGSSLTKNLRETPYNTNDRVNPITPSTITAMRMVSIIYIYI